MQLAITLLLILDAASYTAYALWRTIFPAKRDSSGCGSGCGKCSMTVQLHEKGEPVTLVPLQIRPKL